MSDVNICILHNEEWRHIVGFEDYIISSFGRVKCNKKNGYFSFQDNGKGYKSIMLRRNGKSFRRYVHRLVAITFIGPPNGKDVNHIDGNKSNNKLSNLEYLSRKENILHAMSIGIIGSKKGRMKGELHFRSKKVVDLETGIAFNSISECAETYGLHRSTMTNVMYSNKNRRFKFI